MKQCTKLNLLYILANNIANLFKLCHWKRVIIASAQSCQHLCYLPTWVIGQGETSAKELVMWPREGLGLGHWKTDLKKRSKSLILVTWLIWCVIQEKGLLHIVSTVETQFSINISLTRKLIRAHMFKTNDVVS